MTTKLESLLNIQDDVIDTLDIVLSTIREEPDSEETKIKEELSTIYKNALNAFEAQQDMSQNADPRFSARNSEVAAQFLNIALNATKARTDAKHKRDTLKTVKTDPNSVTNNNLIVTDRNSLLDMIRSKQI